VTDRELQNLLTQAGNTPEFGSDFSGIEERAWTNVLQSIGKSDIEAQPFGVREYMGYIFSESSQLVLRPLMVSVFALSLMFGGWIASVNASIDSLPGDVLYSVKLATEKMQIQFASSQQRAKLHTEFATRRLQEVTDLSVSDRPDKEEQVTATVQKFQEELQQARTELATARQDKSTDVVAIASAIDIKNDQLKSLLDQTSEISSVTNKEDVERAKTEVRESEAQVLDTLVENHETTPEPRNTENLQLKFQTMYRDLVKRSALNRGRLEVITTKITEASKILGIEEKELEATLQDLRTRNSSYDKDLADAQNLLAAGGFRTSFEKLQSIDNDLRQIEEALADIEISLTSPVLLPKDYEPPGGGESTEVEEKESDIKQVSVF